MAKISYSIHQSPEMPFLGQTLVVQVAFPMITMPQTMDKVPTISLHPSYSDNKNPSTTETQYRENSLVMRFGFLDELMFEVNTKLLSQGGHCGTESKADT